MEQQQSSFSMYKDIWVSTWMKPRETIKKVLAMKTYPGGFLIALVIIGALYARLEQFFAPQVSIIMGIVGAIIVAAVGVLFWYIGAWLLGVVAKWLKGDATNKEIRTSLALSNVPILAVCVIEILFALVYGSNFIVNLTNDAMLEEAFIVPSMILGVLSLVAGIWSLVILLTTFAEIQKFSVWKALGNFILAGLILLIPLWVVLTFFGGFLFGLAGM